eukprot:8942226-Ditylum_brightwellii.AAC.2
MTQDGQKHPKINTKGWFLKVEWKDDTLSWVLLSKVKIANPVEVAEYAVAAKIDDDPAFKWWIYHALRERKYIISKVRSRYWRTTHKFSSRLPHSMKEAYEIDKQNGNEYWCRAIERKMLQVRITFETWKGE